jgi:hypothetical protein
MLSSTSRTLDIVTNPSRTADLIIKHMVLLLECSHYALHDLAFERFRQIHNYQRHNLFHFPFLEKHKHHHR